MIRFALVLTLLSVLAACGAEDEAVVPAGTKDPLVGKTFRSTKVTEDGKDRPLVAGTRISLRFTDRGDLEVRAGCNHLGGRVTVGGGTLRLADTRTTSMGCDRPRTDQDAWISTVLGAEPTWRLDGDELTLTTDTTEIRLTSSIAADEVRGIRWAVGGFLSGGGVTGSPPGVEAYLEFDGERVTGNSGCNRLSGPAVLGPNTIEFGPIVSTKMACGGPRDTTEKAILAVLNSGTVTIETEDARLNLIAGDKGLQLQRS